MALGLLLAFRGPLGPIVLHDSLAVYWVWADQFSAEIARGVLYPRWMPASDGGLGTPVFYYYPPLAFYLAAAFHGLGMSIYASLIATFASAFAASGISCWHWLRGRSNAPLIGALFFTAAPYHLFNYVDRGALAESVATAMLPLVAIGLRSIAEQRRGIVFTALAYAAMIGTHLPLALLVGVFFVVPYALLHRDRLFEFVCATAIGIGLAAIYVLPALALAPYHDVSQLYRTANLRTDYWNLFSGNWSDPTFAAIMTTIAAISAAAAVIAIASRDRCAVGAFLVCGLAAGLVPLVWSSPILRDVQFPYRVLPIAEFALATAIARAPHGAMLVRGAAAIPLVVSAVLLPGFYSVGADIQRLGTMHPDVYEYLPRHVMAPGRTSAKLSDVLAPRNPPPTVPGMVVEPHFYFPAWSCGTAEPRTQLLMHRPGCAPQIVWTAAEKAGAAISLVASLIAAGFLLGGRRNRTLLPRRI